jgi:glutaredoxin
MNLKIYSTSNCPRCNLLKSALQKAGIAYEEADMTASESRAAMLTGGCFSLSAPVLQIGEDFYGPELFPPNGQSTMLDTGKLEAILAGNVVGKANFSGTGGHPQEKFMDCRSIWR